MNRKKLVLLFILILAVGGRGVYLYVNRTQETFTPFPFKYGEYSILTEADDGLTAQEFSATGDEIQIVGTSNYILKQELYYLTHSLTKKKTVDIPFSDQIKFVQNGSRNSGENSLVWTYHIDDRKSLNHMGVINLEGTYIPLPIELNRYKKDLKKIVGAFELANHHLLIAMETMKEQYYFFHLSPEGKLLSEATSDELFGKALFQPQAETEQRPLTDSSSNLQLDTDGTYVYALIQSEGKILKFDENFHLVAETTISEIESGYQDSLTLQYVKSREKFLVKVGQNKFKWLDKELKWTDFGKQSNVSNEKNEFCLHYRVVRVRPTFLNLSSEEKLEEIQTAIFDGRVLSDGSLYYLEVFSPFSFKKQKEKFYDYKVVKGNTSNSRTYLLVKVPAENIDVFLKEYNAIYENADDKKM